MEKEKKKINEWLVEDEKIFRIIKVAGGVTASMLLIYCLGHVFKISANTIRGFQELKKSLNGR